MTSHPTVSPIPCPYVTFLRTVAERKPAPRGPDGGYKVPRHLYSHLLENKKRPDAAGPQDIRPHSRLFALAPLSNAALSDADETKAKAVIETLIMGLCLKVSPQVIRVAALEMEASAEATYVDDKGKARSAFAHDETVFRVTLRVPDIQPDQPTQTSLGAEVGVTQ